jgi:hypothetical protein
MATVEQLEERIQKLELQITSMAEIVASAIYWTFGADFEYDSWASLDWDEFLIPGAELDSDLDELYGFWKYAVNERAKERALADLKDN